ncbi:MAG: hypothetical protein IPI31_12800 [Bacteroidetes bacterium]|jgi:hypothetical protein|nr:hypothetical protein [Bacteroidota bacterium]MBK7568692.1 hypothetical protein [Bacteroidota bacterium]MBP8915609.1 hypothetical protein [Chitinophagales bacterium]MBP9189733.1 hypothetical protein [Chitinophagales bacterium]MBP9794603.1 hypothetical protein [Chitinophagales bacterium]
MAKVKRYIMKGFGLIILASVLQSYACSGLCSTKLSDCEEELKPKHDCCNRAIPLESDNDKDKSDCQDDHFVFLQTLGQFHSFNAFNLDKPFFVADISISIFQVTSVYFSQNTVAVYTGFVPPPPKDGIPIFIQSFLI